MINFKMKRAKFPEVKQKPWEKKMMTAVKSQMLIEVEQDVPFRSGAMFRSLLGSFKDTTPYIKSSKVYSQIVYDGIGKKGSKLKFNTSKHSRAKAEFLEVSWKRDRKKFEKVIVDTTEKMLKENTR